MYVCNADIEGNDNASSVLGWHLDFGAEEAIVVVIG